MQIETQQHGAVTVIRPKGPLVQEDAGIVGDRLINAMREHMGRVVFDAAEVPYLDSVGLEALLDATEAMSRSGEALKICALNETIREVLELTELATMFENFEDINAAVRSFL